MELDLLLAHNVKYIQMMLIIALILIVGMMHSPCIPNVSISKPSQGFDNGVNLH